MCSQKLTNRELSQAVKSAEHANLSIIDVFVRAYYAPRGDDLDPANFEFVAKRFHELRRYDPPLTDEAWHLLVMATRASYRRQVAALTASGEQWRIALLLPKRWSITASLFALGLSLRWPRLAGPPAWHYSRLLKETELLAE